MIWADRLAIAFFLLTGGLIGIVYAFWGEPGTFTIFEKVIAVVTAFLWFGARVLDWAATGRIRSRTTKPQ